MSIKDYNSVLLITDMTKNEVIDKISNDTDFEISNYRDIFCSITLKDLRILDSIHKCIDNGNDCFISLGYGRI